MSDKKKFEVKIGVHQGSVFNPLLFALVMDEVAKNVRESGVKELLYADDLLKLGDSWEEVKIKYMLDGKKLLMEKGLKVNVKKRKLSVLMRELYH